MSNPLKLLVTFDSEGNPIESWVPMSDEEYAVWLADQQAGRDEQADFVQDGLAKLVARCDRYLADTDWIMLPSGARPIDMSAALAKECDDNAQAWIDWRAVVRTVRGDARNGTLGEIPAWPPVPAVSLT